MKLKTLYEEIKNSNLKKWFGTSKVKESGNPKVVYHGTNSKDIKKFDINKLGQNSGNQGHYGAGFYFSEDITEAKGYGSTILECYLKITKPFTGTDDEYLLLKNEGLNTVEDYVIKSIKFNSLYNAFSKIDKRISDFLYILKNKKDSYAAFQQFKKKYGDVEFELNDIYDIYEYTKEGSDGVPDYTFELLRDFGVDVQSLDYVKGFAYDQSLHYVLDVGAHSKQFTDIIIKHGYDGVIYGSEYVVFKPNQVKSIKNDGSWDINDDDIYS